MALLKRLFAPGRNTNQQQVAGRAAHIIDHVIFDVGIDSLVLGKILLDKKFRPRFYGGGQVPAHRAIAAVAVGQLAEAAWLRSQAKHAWRDPAALRQHTGCLVQALIREFKAQSPAFRALP
jgi:hypothetical protein